jgi:hypothetical protein
MRVPLVVRMAAGPNPDFGQYEDNYQVPSRVVEVPDLSVARQEARRYIGDHDLGGGNFGPCTVHDATGVHVANISYNGRVWTPEPWPKCSEIVLDPRRPS